MDRNTVIGFALLAFLFIGYYYYNTQGQQLLEKQKMHIQDSLDKIHSKIDTAQLKAKNTDSISIVPASNLSSGLIQDSSLTEGTFTIENNLAKYTFTNKGGQPKIVELKKFKTAGGQPLLLNDGKFNDISYEIRVGNQTLQSSNLLFTAKPVMTSTDSSQVVSFLLTTANGETIEHQYVLKPDDYMVDFTIKMNGANSLLYQNTLNFVWAAKATQSEKEIEWEMQQSQVAFVENNEYDFERIVKGKDDTKVFPKTVDWVAINQQFFVTSFIAKNKFASGDLKWEAPKDTSLHIIGKATAHLKLNVQGNDATIPLQLYYGPNDYKILKSYDNGMQNIVPLGSGVFAFIKYVNRGFIMPVFNFLSTKMASYGLIIALLTIIIRLLISPLTYQSYLSGAKMKLLKPEIEELKKKHGEDKQAFGMDQMKLFKSAGVNPLGGCIPAVLQIPIFFALYNFFNSNISLRGQSFLWANDLSSYDSIYHLPFSIPFYGDHVSLFTILATVTSLLISLYGMSNMQDTGNPMMKYLPFIFPVVLLGVFNRMPAALTWYYTVSNVITLLIQFVIQTYIIDHDKILAKLQENKKRPVSKSKWQDKIDAMQNSNDKLKQMKAKNDARKK
ncbi:MAG: membrane protein insertase YidC [Ginsengibacter sp.]|jgi:YidC/Oxa1 family membrane protein insertase